MDRSRTWRVLVLVITGVPSVVGVWAAHKFGRAALGGIGGVLVAFVAALMLGAVVLIMGVILLRPAPPPRGSAAGSHSTRT